MARILIREQNLPQLFKSIEGSWQGIYALWLDPSKPPQESKSNIEIKVVAGGSHCLIEYQWSTGGKAKEGVFLLSGHENKIMGTWVDSFHSTPFPIGDTSYYFKVSRL